MKTYRIQKLATLLTLLFNFTFLIFNCSAQLTPIQYNASDFTGTTNNLPVTLTSLQRLRINNQTMLVGLPISFTPVNGGWTTNIYPGLYNLTIQGIPDGVTCLVPAATNTQTLASCVISNMGLFSASNLNALITNEVFLLGGTNIQVTTNGFTYTINGVVTNLNGLTISNGVLVGVFAGNGSGLSGLQPTNSTLTWLGLYPTNGIAYTIQLNALSNAIPAANLIGLIPPSILTNSAAVVTNGQNQIIYQTPIFQNSFVAQNIGSPYCQANQATFGSSATPILWAGGNPNLTNADMNPQVSLATPNVWGSGSGMNWLMPLLCNLTNAGQFYCIFTNYVGTVSTNLLTPIITNVNGTIVGYNVSLSPSMNCNGPFGVQADSPDSIEIINNGNLLTKISTVGAVQDVNYVNGQVITLPNGSTFTYENGITGNYPFFIADPIGFGGHGHVYLGSKPEPGAFNNHCTNFIPGIDVDCLNGNVVMGESLTVTNNLTIGVSGAGLGTAVFSVNGSQWNSGTHGNSNLINAAVLDATTAATLTNVTISQSTSSSGAPVPLIQFPFWGFFARKYNIYWQSVGNDWIGFDGANILSFNNISITPPNGVVIIGGTNTTDSTSVLQIQGRIATGTITVTNSPTFAHTNTAPGNTTTPVLWIDITNGGSIYKMPLYQ